MVGVAAFAIHPYSLLMVPRPETLDTSTTVLSRGGLVSASYTSEPAEIPLGAIHTWTVTLTDKDGNPVEDADMSLSADMPEHRHGTTTRPRVSPAGTPGSYRVEGMNFHMPGWWRITLDVSCCGSRDLARFDLVVGEGEHHSRHRAMEPGVKKAE